MKKVINGKVYNTETTTLVCIYDNGKMHSDFHYIHEELYVKRTGEFFLYGEGGAASKYGVHRGDEYCFGTTITPLTKSEAMAFEEWCGSAENGIEF